MFSGKIRLGHGIAAALGVVALAGPVAGAGAATASVRRHHTAAGMTAARAVLLRRRELGRGWSSTPPADPRAQPLTCPAFNPPLGKDVEIGAASTPAFSRSATGPFVSQTAFAYSTPAQGRSVARTIMRNALMNCLAGSLIGQSTSTVTFTVAHQRRLGMPSLGDRAVRYRISGSAAQTGQSVNVYLDAIVMTRARIVTEVSFATFQAPPSRSLEVHAARVIARHLLSVAG